MPFIQWVKVTRNIRQESTGFNESDFREVISISPHKDILRFEGKIPTSLQLRVYIIIFPESFMTFPPLKWGCYAAAV